jgi:curved DNA-binding protein CbpA
VNSQQQEINYYQLLGLHPSASAIEIRRSYRELSKKYHPDTTALPAATATAKFQALNEAYATLSHSERRAVYDRQIGYARTYVMQPLNDFRPPPARPFKYRSSAYLDPNDRPLSGGELFALSMLLSSFVACLAIAIFFAYAD